MSDCMQTGPHNAGSGDAPFTPAVSTPCATIGGTSRRCSQEDEAATPIGAAAVACKPVPPATAGPATRIDKVDVVCNRTPGTLLITAQAILCRCGECRTAPANQRTGGRIMTPTEFERHAGMLASKKWRRSIKVVGAGGNAAAASGGLSVGRWLEQHGFVIDEDSRSSTPRGGGGGGARGGDADAAVPRTGPLPVHVTGGSGASANSSVGNDTRGNGPPPKDAPPVLDMERLLSVQSSLLQFGMPHVNGSPAAAAAAAAAAAFMHPHLQMLHHQQQQQQQQQQQRGHELHMRMLAKADSGRSCESGHTLSRVLSGVTAEQLGPDTPSKEAGSARGDGAASGIRQPRVQGGKARDDASGGGAGVPEDDLLAAASALELLKQAPSQELGNDSGSSGGGAAPPAAEDGGASAHQCRLTADAQQPVAAAPSGCASAGTKRSRHATGDTDASHAAGGGGGAGECVVTAASLDDAPGAHRGRRLPPGATKLNARVRGAAVPQMARRGSGGLPPPGVAAAFAGCHGMLPDPFSAANVQAAMLQMHAAHAGMRAARCMAAAAAAAAAAEPPAGAAAAAAVAVEDRLPGDGEGAMGTDDGSDSDDSTRAGHEASSAPLHMLQAGGGGSGGTGRRVGRGVPMLPGAHSAPLMMMGMGMGMHMGMPAPHHPLGGKHGLMRRLVAQQAASGMLGMAHPGSMMGLPLPGAAAAAAYLAAAHPHGRKGRAARQLRPRSSSPQGSGAVSAEASGMPGTKRARHPCHAMDVPLLRRHGSEPVGPRMPLQGDV